MGGNRFLLPLSLVLLATPNYECSPQTLSFKWRSSRPVQHDKSCQHNQLGDVVAGTCQRAEDCPAIVFLSYAEQDQDALPVCPELTEEGEQLMCCPRSFNSELLVKNKCAKYLWEERQLGPHRVNERVSKRKCREYSRTICDWRPDSPPPYDFLETTCANAGPRSLVIGGAEAEHGDLPFMALLGYEADDDTTCGGTLISASFILTAAHCVRRSNGSAWTPTWVKLGAIVRDDPQALTLAVDQVIVHPDYYASTNVLYNDIALLRLSDNVSFWEHVRPACLHAAQDGEPTDGQVATVAGWGMTEKKKFAVEPKKIIPEGHFLSKHLLYATIPIFNVEECQSRYRSAIYRSQMCAGGLTTRDAGKGDSGGPLYVHTADPYCSYLVLGITSMGRERSATSHPVIFTRVASFVSWIEEVVWPGN